jgi:iron complex transport system ATP-binding protein
VIGMSTCIDVQDITFGYRPADPVLDRVSFALETGSFLAIVGPNGAGKSTLVSLLAGLLKPLSGKILIDGQDIRTCKIRHLARKVAVVRPEYAPVFGFSVAETVLMARIPFYGQLGFETQRDRDLVHEALERTDTARFAERPVSQLSGGERQRVFIARALAQDTPIILLDEPTNFLDLHHQVSIYDLLKSIQQEKGRTIVSVTHEINLAGQYCDQALLLEPCQKANSNPGSESPVDCRHYRIGSAREVLTATSIERAFGVRVFSATVAGRTAFIPLGREAQNTSGPTVP